MNIIKLAACASEGTTEERLRDLLPQMPIDESFPTLLVPFGHPSLLEMRRKDRQLWVELIKRRAPHKEVIGLAGAQLVKGCLVVKAVLKVSAAGGFRAVCAGAGGFRAVCAGAGGCCLPPCLPRPLTVCALWCRTWSWS
jgi:hypothetical protein